MIQQLPNWSCKASFYDGKMVYLYYGRASAAINSGCMSLCKACNNSSNLLFHDRNKSNNYTILISFLCIIRYYWLDSLVYLLIQLSDLLYCLSFVGDLSIALGLKNWTLCSQDICVASCCCNTFRLWNINISEAVSEAAGGSIRSSIRWDCWRCISCVCFLIGSADRLPLVLIVLLIARLPFPLSLYPSRVLHI